MARLAVGIAIATLWAVLVSLVAPPAGAEMVDLQVPYHEQAESWYCAEASLQMVFDYWGEEIPQHDIGDVANERQVGGTYASDLERAARFSNRSSAVQPREGGGDTLQGYDQRPYGYGAFTKQWMSPAEDRLGQLKALIRAGYPVILLCWLDEFHTVTHYRVLKGFDEEAHDLIFHDPALGANKRLDVDVFMDDLWTYYDRWGLVVVPWSVELDAPEMVGPGVEFQVWANVTYDCPELFVGTDPYISWPQDAEATITVPPPFALAQLEASTKGLNITRAGYENGTVWRLVSPSEEGIWEVEIEVLAGALVKGQSITYGVYTDFIGGMTGVKVVCDAVAPVFDQLEVVGGPLLREPEITFAYSASDVGSGVWGVAWSFDPNLLAWGVTNKSSGERTYQIFPLEPEGNRSIWFKAFDLFENTVVVELEFFLDSKPPVIEAFELAGGRAIVTQRVVPVAMRAVDATSEVELMSLQVGPTTWGPWQPYEEQFQLELSSDGDYTVSVRVRDSMGHVAATSAAITLDTTPPYITVFQVAGGLHFATHRTVNVTLSAFDNLDGELEGELVEAGIGASGTGTPIALTSGNTLNLQWTFAEDGERTLTLHVFDRAMHGAEASRDLVVDTQPPLVSIVLNGGDPMTTRAQVPVALSAIDVTSEVGEARIRVDENAWGPWADTATFRRIDLGPGDGQRVVHVEVQDTAGNVAGASASIKLDQSAPTAAVTFTRLVPGGVVHESTSILVTFSEPMDMSSVEVLLLDNSSGVVECALEWSGQGTVLNITPVRPLPRERSFTLSVQGRDPIGNELEPFGTVFSTPESEGDDWELHITGDTAVLLLVLILSIATIIALSYGLAKRRG